MSAGELTPAGWRSGATTSRQFTSSCTRCRILLLLALRYWRKPWAKNFLDEIIEISFTVPRESKIPQIHCTTLLSRTRSRVQERVNGKSYSFQLNLSQCVSIWACGCEMNNRNNNCESSYSNFIQPPAVKISYDLSVIVFWWVSKRELEFCFVTHKLV